jgi:hypothetical protein
MMCEGVFLHSNVETPYGPVRAMDGGFYRFSPQRFQLERTAQLAIPNPWELHSTNGAGLSSSTPPPEHELAPAGLRDVDLWQHNGLDSGSGAAGATAFAQRPGWRSSRRVIFLMKCREI